MPQLKKTKRTKVVRGSKRASYDRDTIHAIIDEALVCHVAFIVDGSPVVVPTNHWREGDHLYFHGSTASRRLRAMAEGAEVCVSVTLVDGLVLGRSAMHHSMNFRSVVVFGRAAPVEDPKRKMAALEALMERVAPGRWAEVRPPNDKEMQVTVVLAMPITEASAKIRSGPPVDDEEDYALPVWAGEVPLAETAGEPVPDPRLAPGTEVPAYLRKG